MIKCPLCGRRFNKEESRSGCTACGKAGCGLVKCPNCAYEFPPDPTLEDGKEDNNGFFKKIFGREKK